MTKSPESKVEDGAEPDVPLASPTPSHAGPTKYADEDRPWGPGIRGFILGMVSVGIVALVAWAWDQNSQTTGQSHDVANLREKVATNSADIATLKNVDLKEMKRHTDQSLKEMRTHTDKKFKEFGDSLDSVKLEVTQVKSTQDSHGRYLKRTVEDAKTIRETVEKMQISNAEFRGELRARLNTKDP